MNDTVLLVVSDTKYLPHAKSLLAGAVRQGSWVHDFALLCPQDCNTASIENRGIEIIRALEDHWSNVIKFRIFSPQFRRWKRVLYLDADILFQGNLTKACDEMAFRSRAILCDGTSAVAGPSGVTILQDWEHFDTLSGTGPASHPQVYERLRQRFPHIDKPLFASDAMLFDPGSIPDGTVERLFAVQEEFKEANPRGYDQQVMNLVLYDRMAGMGKDYITWWAFDDPGNRVADVARGWRGDEIPVMVHYWEMYAPWLDKTHDAGAYFNSRLGRPCREVYLENLNAFETVFPQRG